MATVKVARGRDVIEIPEENLSKATDLGYEPLDNRQAKRISDVKDAATLTGGLRGAGEAAARGASLGFSDSALRAMGVDAGGLAARAEGDGSKILEVAGAIAPAVLSGGSSTAATAARFTLAGRAAQVGRAVTGATEAAVGRGLVGRVAGGTAAGAFEGALSGMGGAASEAALGDRDLAAEHLLAGTKRGAGLGALFGAGTTTLGIGLEHAYSGSRKVAGGLVEKALGAGDDATTAAGRASFTGDSVLEKAAQRQVRLLGGGDVEAAAASRHLARTRTAEGRSLMELAEKGGRAVDDAVGQRLRSVSRTSTKAYADEWSKGLKPGARQVQRQAAEAAQALKGTQLEGVKAVRKILRSVAKEEPSYEGYIAGRAKVQAALDEMRASGDAGLARAEEAAASYLGSADDPAIWGEGIKAAGPMRAAQAAEREALAALRPRARKALEAGGDIDDAAAVSLAKSDPAALSRVLDARASMADTMESLGRDVGDMRRGIEEMRSALKYRATVAEAAGDAGILKALEEGPGSMARKGLEVGGKAIGSVLGGLSFGGAALGELAGQVLGAATRPAATIRTVARARGAIDAVRARQGAAVEAFAKLASKTGDVAARGARGAGAVARRVPPAVARQEQRARRTELLETMRRVTTLARDPDALAKDLGPAVVQLRASAPNVAGSVIAGAARAAAYLAAVAPPVIKPTGTGKVEMVDPFALESWGRRVDAASDPMETIDKLGKGTLTREEAETIKAVFPKMWTDLQDQIMRTVGEAARDGRALSFAARTQLGILGEVITDDSLRPADYAQIQASMAVTPPHPAAPPPRSQIKPTAPSLPKWQAMEQKA